ncbi:MAG: transporter substrate-binding domain-containing protein [Chlamydiales bacterium]|nr:transporter substrate-binding domain-containing protein [Chlamydiales bacterium]
MAYKIRNISLNIQIFIALAIGILLGFTLSDSNIALAEILSVAYLKITKLIALCAIVFSIVTSVYQQPSAATWKNLKKVAALFFAFTITIYSFSYAFNQIFTPALFTFTYSSSSYFVDTSSINEQLTLFFTSLSSIAYPAIILIAILFGLALAGNRQKENHMHEILNIIDTTLHTTLNWFFKLFPLFTLCFAASAIAKLNQNAFLYLKFYILSFYLLTLLLSFFLFPQLLKLFASIRKREFMYQLSLPMLIAFVSGSAILALPATMTAINKFKLEKDQQSNHKWLLGLLISLPSFGGMLSSFYILYLAQFYHVVIPFLKHIEIITLGTFSIFNNHVLPTNGISFLIDRLHLPIDGNSLYLQSLAYTSNITALFSIIAISSLSILCVSNKKVDLKFSRLCIGFFIPVACSAILILLLRSYLPALPAEKPLSKSYEIDSSAQVIVSKTFPTEEDPRYFLHSPAEIKEKRELRVGYLPFIPPFSFPDAKQEQVGLDIAMAHKLAESLDVNLRLVPYKLPELEKMLKEGYIDIAMSGLAISPKRLKKLAFTSSYHLASNALLVLDSKRKNFESYQTLRDNPNLSIAILQESSLDEHFEHFFPKANKVSLNHVNEFTNKPQLDAMFWKYEQALAFSLEHPEYTAIIPSPSIGKELYAYVTHPKSQLLIDHVNEWLDILQTDETIDREKEKWFQLQQAEKPSRWRLL